MTTIYTIHPADNLRASVFGAALVPIDSRYSSAAELCQAIRAAAETAPECPAPRVERAFPGGAYAAGPSEIITSDNGRAYFGQPWQGPIMPEPAQPDVIRVEFHFTANGARSSITAANLRPDLLRLANRVHAARNLYDGKTKRAPRPARPASSAPHVTARAMWDSGDRAGALAFARNVGAVFFGAAPSPKPGAVATGSMPYMVAEHSRAADEDWIIGRAIPTCRFRVLHLETACSADPDGFTSSAAALAWLEDRAQCEDWRAKLRAAIAKAAPFSQAAAAALDADDADDAPESAPAAANDSGAPVDPDPAAPGGIVAAPSFDDLIDAQRAELAAAPICSAWNPPAEMASDAAPAAEVAPIDAAEVARIVELWRDKPGAAAELRARAANMRSDGGRGAGWTYPGQAQRVAQSEARAAVYCAAADAIEQRAPDPAPVKETPYMGFCPVRAAVYRAQCATYATARAIEGYSAQNPAPAGGWDDRIPINRLRARGADRPAGAQALRDRVAAKVRADRAARRAVPMASPGYAFAKPPRTYAFPFERLEAPPCPHHTPQAPGSGTGTPCARRTRTRIARPSTRSSTPKAATGSSDLTLTPRAPRSMPIAC